ncbi:DUF1819 family protein [Methylicorpusculum sp.]|uniref:DUF1819 family protein n=1 Tax=Methylicorpusculum sp. TaxID=2713644 RepID=UPI00272F75EF|nr:DUF1819 family protein [Methylicorpusculum sp.]MDP2180736.1 DUF1819 family protein [Methylicorpusculum sp.]MDZ4152899.1 DUF1819 family protein [Methylicorpusculum sp.]
MTTYNAEISAGSLMPLESRRIAAFLLTHPDEITWRRALVEDNLLQKKAPATALRQAQLIRKRLNTMDSAAWEMIVNREQEVAVQLLLVAAVKHSQLLADFISDVYIDHQRRLNLAITSGDWEGFLIECAHRDSSISKWSASTQVKLFEVVRRILVEAKYLESTRSMKLTPQSLHPDVRRYLTSHGDSTLLERLERA